MVQPGDDIPPEAPSSSSPPQGHGRTVLSTGAIIGISMGGAAVVGLAGALFFFVVGRAKTLEDFLGRRHVGMQDRASHLYTEQNPGFQGCAAVKEDQVAGYPPAYSSPMMGGRVYAAHRSGAGYDDPKQSVMSPGVEMWRTSGYGGQAQELEAQCAAAGRR